jgi:hypothetical protein
VGKEILLKAVIQAIPTYCMSIFQLPKVFCSKINSLMEKFWQGTNKKENGIHWMKWERLGLSKAKGGGGGGLGFRDFNIFNKALLSKQVWRLWKVLDSLTAQIVKAKYCPNVEVLDAGLGNKPSFVWRSIVGAT